jgi:hypothetical protein
LVARFGLEAVNVRVSLMGRAHGGSMENTKEPEVVAVSLRFPLLFFYSHLIAGQAAGGFLARVKAHGRVLLTLESDGEFWFYGVNPGGAAGGGASPDEAHLQFKENYRAILNDLASEASSFGEFQSAVTEFFNATNVPNEAEWTSAVREVREKGLSLGNMRKVQDATYSIVVEEIPLARPAKIELASSEDATEKLELVTRAA